MATKGRTNKMRCVFDKVTSPLYTADPEQSEAEHLPFWESRGCHAHCAWFPVPCRPHTISYTRLMRFQDNYKVNAAAAMKTSTKARYNTARRGGESVQAPNGNGHRNQIGHFACSLITLSRMALEIPYLAP